MLNYKNLLSSKSETLARVGNTECFCHLTLNIAKSETISFRANSTNELFHHNISCAWNSTQLFVESVQHPIPILEILGKCDLFLLSYDFCSLFFSGESIRGI